MDCYLNPPLLENLRQHANGLIWMSEDGFRQAVAHNASPAQIALMSAVQRPISVACIQEKAPDPAWRKKPTWYLVAEWDRMIVPETQHFMAERMGAIISSYPVDHTPMYTAPNLVVDVIQKAAREAIQK